MILITGGNGQLGSELRHLLDEQQLAYVATDSSELDITDAAATMAKVQAIKPTVIYHCAAYTAVDKAEDEGKELDELVNIQGSENVAKAAEAVGATMVYISTDYVFDGQLTDGEYTVDAPTHPLNEYGRTKLAGEQAVQQFASKHYIIRTSWVFGKYGHNFVFTMQKLAQTHPKLTVVNDQFGRPTWTRTLAEFMTYAVANEVPYGVYHLSNEHACTWYDFAKEILKDTDVTIDPVTSEQFPQKAHRPQHSVMDLSKAKATGFMIPTWEEALAEMLEGLEGN